MQRDLLARGRVANVNVKQCLEDGHGDTQFVYIYVRVSSFVWRIRVARVETESEIGKEGERRRRRRSVARKGGEAAKNFGYARNVGARSRSSGGSRGRNDSISRKERHRAAACVSLPCDLSHAPPMRLRSRDLIGYNRAVVSAMGTSKFDARV